MLLECELENLAIFDASAGASGLTAAGFATGMTACFVVVVVVLGFFWGVGGGGWGGTTLYSVV